MLMKVIIIFNLIKSCPTVIVYPESNDRLSHISTHILHLYSKIFQSNLENISKIYSINDSIFD